eukprot:gene9209-11285_t
MTLPQQLIAEISDESGGGSVESVTLEFYIESPEKDSFYYGYFKVPYDSTPITKKIIIKSQDGQFTSSQTNTVTYGGACERMPLDGGRLKIFGPHSGVTGEFEYKISGFIHMPYLQKKGPEFLAVSEVPSLFNCVVQADGFDFFVYRLTCKLASNIDLNSIGQTQYHHTIYVYTPTGSNFPISLNFKDFFSSMDPELKDSPQRFFNYQFPSKGFGSIAARQKLKGYSISQVDNPSYQSFLHFSPSNIVSPVKLLYGHKSTMAYLTKVPSTESISNDNSVTLVTFKNGKPVSNPIQNYFDQRAIQPIGSIKSELQVNSTFPEYTFLSIKYKNIDISSIGTNKMKLGTIDVSLPLPYGLKSGDLTSQEGYVYQSDLYISKYYGAHNLDFTINNSTSKISESNLVQDKSKPYLQNIDFDNLFDYDRLLYLNIEDSESGVQSISYSDVFNMGVSSLKSGDNKKGVVTTAASVQQLYKPYYDKRFKAKDFYKICDYASNCVSYDFNILANFQPVGNSLAKFEHIGLRDLIGFKFALETLSDFSSGKTNNSLQIVFPLISYPEKMIPSIKIGTPSQGKVFYGLMKINPNNVTVDIQFEIDTTSIYNYKVIYSLFIFNVEYTNIDLVAFYGDNANLRVPTFFEFDKSPPIISKVSVLPGNNVNVDVNGNGVELFWNIEIEDISKLDFAIVNLTSQYDYKEYSFKLEPKISNIYFIGGNSYTSQFRVSLKVPPLCKTQSYFISSVYTKDHLGNIGISGSNQNIEPISDYFSDSIIKTVCTDNLEIPTISKFDITEVGNGQVIFNVEIISKTSTISERHPPIIYLQELNGRIIPIETSLSTKNDTQFSAKYVAQVVLPYGFGGKTGVLVSIYGISDTRLNFNGYSHQDLKNSGFKAFLNNAGSYKYAVEKISDSIALGINFSILGYGFDGRVPVEYSFQSPIKFSPIKFSLISSNKINFKFTASQIVASKGSIIIKVGDIYQKSINITPLYDTPLLSRTPNPKVIPESFLAPKEPTFLCFSNPYNTSELCGGESRGSCIQNTRLCQCKDDYKGFDCLSRPHESQEIKSTFNSTSPIFTFLLKDETYMAEFYIRGMKEMNDYGKISDRYSFNTWKYELKNENEINPVHHYQTFINHKGTPVKFSMDAQWITKQEIWTDEIGTEINTPPSTLRFKFKIEGYVFYQMLDKLQILIDVHLKKVKNPIESCSAKEFVNYETNYQYFKLKVDKTSIYGSLRKFGLSDNDVSHHFQNYFLENATYPTEASVALTQLGLTVPYFGSTGILSSEFSFYNEEYNVLASGNFSKCSTEPYKSKAGIIAGSLIGSVFGIVIIAFLVSFFLYHSNRAFKFYLITEFLRRDRDFYVPKSK